MFEDLVGQQLGNYAIRRFLGRGSFADVYLGEHLYLKTSAAIKILRLHVADEARESFLQEAQTIARLEHPSIVRMLDFGIEKERPFLVMGYAPHGTLRQRFRRGILLSPTAIVPYVKQIASALDYAHSRKVIHRDVKPENILLKSEDELVLSDFGLATITQSSLHITSAGQAGTLLYMAPEQIQGEVRAASDQYALGIMVYEWLTGRYPFSGTQFEVIMQQLYVPPPLMMIDLPEELEGLVRRTLMKDPSERFPRAMDFALAFERAAGPLPTSRSITRPVETVRVTQEVSPASSQHSQEESLPIPEVEDDPLLSSSSVQLRRVQLAFLATKPMPAMPSSSLSQANEASHPPLPEKAPKRQARRNVLLGVAGILSAGALGAGLTALFVHLGPPSSPLSPPQTQSPLISASSPSPSTGSSSAKVTPSSTSSPVGGTGPGTTPTDQPVPGSSATPDASGSPTPTSAASLNIQVVQYPATLVNGQTATITVMANEPGVQVTLSVSYNIPPPHTVTVSQTTDSQGLADLSWVVSISQGRKNVSPLATLQVSAGDAQGQTASASLSLPVSR